MVGTACEEGHRHFPPVAVCRHCSGEAKAPYQFSGKGEIYSFATVFEGPAGFNGKTPYHLATIRLEEGPLITAQLTDFGNKEPEIGAAVEMVTRMIKEVAGERSLFVYGYKFRPQLQAEPEQPK